VEEEVMVGWWDGMVEGRGDGGMVWGCEGGRKRWWCEGGWSGGMVWKWWWNGVMEVMDGVMVGWKWWMVRWRKWWWDDVRVEDVIVEVGSDGGG